MSWSDNWEKVWCRLKYSCNIGWQQAKPDGPNRSETVNARKSEDPHDKVGTWPPGLQEHHVQWRQREPWHDILHMEAIGPYKDTGQGDLKWKYANGTGQNKCHEDFVGVFVEETQLVVNAMVNRRNL